MKTTPAVVLARGLGRRMQEAEPGAVLREDQQQAAVAGLKGLMPIGEERRPFLDYVLDSLADAGCTDIVMVVAPDHEAFARYYDSGRLSRIRVRFAVQAEATGTAHAVLAAAQEVGERSFLVLNADNVYPTTVIRALLDLDGPGVPAFERAALVEESGFPEERVAHFALLAVDAAGWLTAIREKPSPADVAAFGRDAKISMNVWRFDERIFAACRDVPRSARNEFELPEAVGLALSRGMRIRAVPASGAVLDLSKRADVTRVAAQLAGKVPRL